MSKHAKATADVYIAGSKTVDDWKAFCTTLTPGGDPEPWQEAFVSYFRTRLSLRYLEPIRVLQENGTYQGEGFSIVAIQCTLVEFLESTVQGRSYRYRPRGAPAAGPTEYSDSSELFVTFLSTRQPFTRDFTRQLAREFYENVRCGLLHEARTKGGWMIWGKNSASTTVVSATERAVYRDDLQSALLEFIEWYGRALLTDIGLQRAFIRKFDSLCQ